MISWIQKYEWALSSQLGSPLSDRITYSNKCAKWIQLCRSYDIVIECSAYCGRRSRRQKTMFSLSRGGENKLCKDLNLKDQDFEHIQDGNTWNSETCPRLYYYLLFENHSIHCLRLLKPLSIITKQISPTVIIKHFRYFNIPYHISNPNDIPKGIFQSIFLLLTFRLYPSCRDQCHFSIHPRRLENRIRSLDSFKR